MQALLFEMKPRAGHEDNYFSHAAKLRPLLDQEEGLIFIDRFKSVSRSGVILSHSLWQDEAAIARWRTHPQHHNSQAAGRNKHFEDYRLRISHVLEYVSKGQEAKSWSAEGAYSKSGSPRFLVIVSSQGAPYSDQGESFVSVNSEDAYANIIDVETEAAGREILASFENTPNAQTAVLCLVSRDYGMFNRAQAPQYFPPVGGQLGIEK
ncbi:MAG: antibiotic biosynthesis monooxygenase [Proteobacteria bacterium]|nr:antibiotic biosynthesis monooxygenase [Pseudomonadota bacterium]